jgi:hypothetical protein
MPHHFILTYNHILHEEETDEEPGEMDVLGFDDDDDDDDDMDMDPVEDELPGLLTDAQKDIEDVIPHHHNGSAS